MKRLLIALTLTALTGCGNFEWFPNDAATPVQPRYSSVVQVRYSTVVQPRYSTAFLNQTSASP